MGPVDDKSPGTLLEGAVFHSGFGPWLFAFVSSSRENGKKNRGRAPAGSIIDYSLAVGKWA
jgi:hypothetical protein